MHRKHLALAAALLLAATDAAAQDADVHRASYRLLANDLRIDVPAETSGRLRLLRGVPGWLDVTTRAVDGLAFASLAGTERNQLILDALDADRVDYVVVVPEEVRVSIRLPGRRTAETFGRLQDRATYRWDAPAAVTTVRGAPDLAAGALYTLEAGSLAPPLVAIAAGEDPLRVSVRLGEPAFRVEADAPLPVQRSGGLRVVAAGEAARELIVHVPVGTRRLDLELDGALALRVRNGQVVDLCAGAVDQRLDGRRRWITLAAPLGPGDSCRTGGRRP